MRFSVGIVVLCGMLAMGAMPRAQAEDAKRIGVVNVSQIFAAYTKVKDVQDALVNLFDADRKAIEAKGKDLKKLEERIRLDPRDPKRDIPFFREIQAFELQKMQFENDYQELARRVEDERTKKMKDVLNKIKAAIRAVGTAEKFDLILRAPEFEDEFDPNPKPGEKPDESKSAAELVRKFRENPVMYFSQGVDVTGKVITKLNDDYKAEAPGNK
jgi:Skp family chaperone for outer membrane proteins